MAPYESVAWRVVNHLAHDILAHALHRTRCGALLLSNPSRPWAHPLRFVFSLGMGFYDFAYP